MKNPDGPGLIDLLVTIFSPLLVAVLTVVFLVGFWGEALWRWVRGK